MGNQVYTARSRVVQDKGIYRQVYMGKAEPVTVGIMGEARTYYGYEGLDQEIPGTMDYLPAMVGA